MDVNGEEIEAKLCLPLRDQRLACCIIEAVGRIDTAWIKAMKA